MFEKKHKCDTLSLQISSYSEVSFVNTTETNKILID